jgi:hypothetical protein
MRQLGASIAHAIKRGIVELSRFDGDTQVIQATMLDDDDVDDMPVYGPQGVAFRIPEQSEVLVVHAMGDASIPSCIGTDQRGARPTEKPGGGTVPEGSGGLHFLGAWRVYLSDDGKVFLAGAADETEPALLGATAVTLYAAHVHPTPFGPTGVPTVSLSTAESTKVFLV